MKLKIKPLSDKALKYYSNHGHFHYGDAGLDLYILEDQKFSPGETNLIKLGISCEPEDGKAYYLFPRSSISKTPLRLSNSIGLIDRSVAAGFATLSHAILILPVIIIGQLILFFSNISFFKLIKSSN